MTAYWLMKSEPAEYSYDALEKDGKTRWDGVRNYQARRNLSQMKVGDRALFYHSVTDKQVVGICEIAKEAYPDPTDATGKWIVVDVIPRERLDVPVSLEAIKQTPQLAEIALVKQARLSVMPLTASEFNRIVAMGTIKKSESK